MEAAAWISGHDAEEGKPGPEVDMTHDTVDGTFRAAAEKAYGEEQSEG